MPFIVRSALLAVALTQFATTSLLANEIWFGTGPNNAGMKEGIYVSDFDESTGKITRAELAYELKGAGWVSLHPTKNVLYATGKVDDKPAVLAFGIDARHELQLLGSAPIGDGGACFLSTDRAGTLLVSTQYGGGSVGVFSLAKDGAIQSRVQLIEHTGGSRVVEGRQNSPHPHSVWFSGDNRFAFAPDLGLDELVRYQVDAEAGKLVSAGTVEVIAGGGPRHMKFHPNGKFAFVLNELSLSVTVFRYDSPSGDMQQLDTVPTLSEESKAAEVFNSASEIRIHPNGKFVYSGNRGHDSISVFEFDAEQASLKAIQVQPIRGSWPRHFNLSSSGKWLVAAGQKSNTASVFAIDQKTGKLTYQCKSAFVPGPICVTFGR